MSRDKLIRTLKCAAVAVTAIVLTVLFTLFFWQTPEALLSRVNTSQNAFKAVAKDTSGNFITGFAYDELKLVGAIGNTLYSTDHLLLGLKLLKLLVGRMEISIQSKEINGFIVPSAGGVNDAKLDIANFAFNTDNYSIPADISFSTNLSGVVVIVDNKATIEIKTDDIQWRKLMVSGHQLPYDLFPRAKAGFVVTADKVVIRSMTFEGEKGTARVMGEIVKNIANLTIEIMPKEWDDPVLIFFNQYKMSPGYYRIPVQIPL